MPTIISPAEQLGLAGAALEARSKRAAQHISDSTWRGIAERLREDAVANRMIYDHEGVGEPIRIMLRPVLARREQLTYVHYVCEQLTEALKLLPALHRTDPDIRRLLRVSEEEEAWLARHWTDGHARTNPVYGRLDAVCDFAHAQWQDSFKFMEPNLSGVGGIHYAPIAEKLVLRDIVPTLVAHDPELTIELLPDQRELFVQMLIDHARAVGRETCNICFIEPKYETDGPDEQNVLIEYLSRRFGLTIAHADPRELRTEGDEVFYEDVKIDVAYRDYETRDVIALEKELGKPVDGMRLLLKQNRIVSSITGDFDHKSGFEVLTDPEIASRLFTAEDCRLFERHVLWTRLVGDRKTSLPNHTKGDLLDYARRNRERLVLKPNRAYGGEGVAIGALVEQVEWARLLNDAAAKYEDPNFSWVLQSATHLPVTDFPVVGPDGKVYSEPFYVVMGFAPTPGGLGIMCRVSQKQVVNVAQHGGLAAVLVVDAPKDLRIPQRSQKRDDGAVKTLRSQIAELKRLDEAISLLGWDEEVYLPPSGRAQRGAQIATLEGLKHGVLSADKLGDLIAEATDKAEGNADLLREIELLHRERRLALSMPESLVREFAQAKSHAYGAWEEARNKNDFGLFVQPMTEVMRLVCQRAHCIAAGGAEPYDALLDEYEPGLTQSRLEPLLAALRERLVPLVGRAEAAMAGDQNPLSGRTFAPDAQWKLSDVLLKTVGFDFTRGRLDATIHPFTSMSGADDIRVTTRIHEDDFTVNMLSTLHEAGHALYDLGFAPGDRDSLLADGASMGLHESQSRLWENHVGRNRGFVHHLFPAMRTLFGDALAGVDANDVWRYLNRIRRSPIRTQADEMTYQLHIILRTELEVALVAGDLKIAELEDAWNRKSKALLDIVPASPREGVLQDVHWASGLFGYFPTYTIGNLYAAQLTETYARGHDLADQLKRGECADLLTWLRDKVHRFGNRLPAEEVVTNATGKGLDVEAYFRHIDSPEQAWRN